MKRLGFLLVAMLSASSCGPCIEKRMNEVKSPDGKYVAALFERNCGATTNFVYHVNLRERSWFWRNIKGAIVEGEVFVNDRKDVNLRWQGEKTLIVECRTCPSDERVYLEPSWNDVKILFQPGPRSD